METKINVKKRECNREKKIKMKKITKKKKITELKKNNKK